MAKPARQIMVETRARASVSHAFWAALMYAMKLEETDAIPTAATDCATVVLYNPKFIQSLDKDVTLFVYAHELSHIANLHGVRRGHRNPVGWNIACDHAINLFLKACGLKVWDKAYQDARFAGMSPEAIYEILKQEAQERQKKRDRQKAGGGQGQPSPGGQGGGGPDGDDAGQPAPDGQDGGSDEPIVDGLPGSAFMEGGPDGVGPDMRPERMTPQQERDAAEAVRGAVARAATVARMAGRLPGELERFVNGVLNPPLPWFDILREFAIELAQDTEDWSRPNRRFTDVILPTVRGVRLGEMAVIVDTSGSCTSAELAQAGHEITVCAEQVRPSRVRVAYCDTRIAREDVFEDGEEVTLKYAGGGGTDMRVALAWAERHDPCVVVLFTDGYTPWPQVEPSYPLIVCCTTDVAVPFGTVVRMRT